MPTQKQQVGVNFSQGVNTKTDPWQLPPGQFLNLENSIFDKGGLLQKRNGFAKLTTAPSVADYLTTLNDNLTGISRSVNAYNAESMQWVSKGTFQPAKVSSLSLIRNNANQSQGDTAVAPNGLACTAYTENYGSGATYKLVVANSVTGQNIVPPTSLSVSSGTVTGSPRVFVLGNYFVIIFANTISGSVFLHYNALPFNNLFTTAGAANIISQQLSANVTSSSATVPWDGVVVEDRLFIGFNSTTGGQSIKVTYLTPQLIAVGNPAVAGITFTGATAIGTSMSLCADTTNSTDPVVYVSMFDTVSGTAKTCSVDFQLNKRITSPVTTITTSGNNIATAAQNGVCTVFVEILNNYSYDSSIPSNSVTKATITAAGTPTLVGECVKSVGLASKAFIVDGVIYFLGAYVSPFQPTYFLINGSTTLAASPKVVAKIAYSNGGGYVTKGLPSVTVTGSVAQIAHLRKDFISSLTTVNNTQQTTTGGVYSQTGINLATIDLDSTINSAEIASSLHIGGGFLWQYDGYLPVEHNFFLWPDSVECAWSATGGSIAAQPDGITNTSAYYYQVTYEWSDNAGNIHRSAPSIPVAVTTTGSGTAGSITIHIPTLRLTYKVANTVKIMIYRWSVASPVYHQVTSLTSPTLNSTTGDSVTFVDTLADASIQGNSIIYTTGGTVENVNAPSTSILTLFDDRVWLVDGEDPNLLWFSKQVIEATPVEMSDLFTFYVAPTTGSQGSTGPVTALAPLDDKLIIFKNNAIYYINGSGPDNVGNSNQYSQPIFITSTVGCANPKSIVFMPSGLMFQSDKGIWLLDRGLNTTYIGAAVEGYTRGATVLGALNIPETNQVRFTLDTGKTLMYDYFFQQWGTFVNIPALSACLYQGLHTFVNSFGTIYQESPGQYLDADVPVTMSFTTSWFNVASLQGFERAYHFYLLGQYYSPHILTVGVAYNYNPSIAHSSTIYPDNFSSAVDSPFGDQPAPFGSHTAIEQWRVFFKQQKCQSFQITLQEYFDPSKGVAAGAGLTLSGLNLTVAAKRGTRPLPARKSVG